MDLLYDHPFQVFGGPYYTNFSHHKKTYDRTYHHRRVILQDMQHQWTAIMVIAQVYGQTSLTYPWKKYETNL